VNSERSTIIAFLSVYRDRRHLTFYHQYMLIHSVINSIIC